MKNNNLQKPSTESASPVRSIRAAATAPPTQAYAPSLSRSGKETVGTVNYLQLPPDGSEPHIILYKRKEDLPPVNFSRKETTVKIHDMRSELDKFTLKEKGVELHRLEVPADINWSDKDEVSERYYPLVRKLLLEVTGATRVHIFDHTLRRGHLKPPTDDDMLNPGVDGKRPVAGMAHVDYTDASGRERLNAILPEEADSLKKTPFGVIQVWRPMKGPVKSSPLGLIDVSTVKEEDFVSYTIDFGNRVGKNYGIKANPEHKWYYASEIDVDEAYVFVCFDSRTDRARFTPHTGFIDFNTPPGVPERESVELRSYCFWEDEENEV